MNQKKRRKSYKFIIRFISEGGRFIQVMMIIDQQQLFQQAKTMRNEVGGRSWSSWISLVVISKWRSTAPLVPQRSTIHLRATINTKDRFTQFWTIKTKIGTHFDLINQNLDHFLPEKLKFWQVLSLLTKNPTNLDLKNQNLTNFDIKKIKILTFFDIKDQNLTFEKSKFWQFSTSKTKIWPIWTFNQNLMSKNQILTIFYIKKIKIGQFLIPKNQILTWKIKIRQFSTKKSKFWHFSTSKTKIWHEKTKFWQSFTSKNQNSTIFDKKKSKFWHFSTSKRPKCRPIVTFKPQTLKKFDAKQPKCLQISA